MLCLNEGAKPSFALRRQNGTGDEGTYSRTQFLKHFKDVTGDFFGEFKMEKDPVFSMGKGRYVISTENASHRSFVRSGTTFKFVSYCVEP